MGDVAKIVGGGTPDSQDPENFSTEHGIPWLTPADLSDNKAIHVARGKRFLTKKGFDNSSARLVPKGTVLFSSRAPIGYVAVAADEISTNQGFKSFVCADGISPEYIYFWLRFATPMAEELASGTTFAEISGKNAAKIPLRLAPLGEQRRIVAKLEALLGKVEASQRRLAKIPVLLKRFRQSVLAAACSGRLTADWREENPQESSPLPVESNKRPLPVIAEDELLFEAPATWRWCRLGSLAAFINGDRGKNYPNKNEYVPEGIPFINTGHIEPDGSLSSESMHHLTRKKFDSLRGGKIQRGDLVYCLRGATLGKTAFVEPYEEGAIASSLVIIRPSEAADRKFLYYFLTSPSGKELVDRFDNGSAQPNLSADSVKNYVIALPPLPEQQQIVRRVEILFALADQLEVRLEKARSRVSGIMPSLLARAFAGQLVPQDPNDEPAERLLERIRKQPGRTKGQ